MRAALRVALIASCITTTAASEEITVGVLLNICSNKREEFQAMCTYYVAGSVHGHLSSMVIYEKKDIFCPPGHLNNRTIAEIFKSWANSHKEYHGHLAAMGIFISMNEASPCR